MPGSLFSIQKSLYPLLAGSFRLEALPAGWGPEPTLFLLDQRKSIDLIDFWNLRALGWDIWPIPIQWANELEDECRELVREVHRPYKHNPDMLHQVTALKSRSVAQDDLKQFCSKVRVPSLDGRGSALVMQHWFPRIWDNSARRQHHVARCRVSAAEDREKVELEEGRLHFGVLTPEFVDDYGSGSAPRWVNVLNLQDFGASGTWPTVFPGDLADCEVLLRSTLLQKITSTTEGLVVRCLHSRDSAHWQLPESKTMIGAWFKQRGFKSRVSSAGDTCLQMLRMVDGPRGASLFNRRELVDLFDKMASGMVEDETPPDARARPKRRSRLITEGLLWATLKRCNDNNDMYADGHLAALLRHQVFRLGLQTDCSRCGQTNWYPLDDVAETVKCERCLSDFAFPSAHPLRSTTWAYRVQGPFSTENYARGAYTVALLLRVLLSDSLSTNGSWLPGVEIKTSDGTTLEADLVAFLRHSTVASAGTTQLLFAECKSFDTFKRKDIERAKTLSSLFPGAAICFATMRDGLSQGEKRELARLASWGREEFDAELWKAPVLVLTGTELFGEWDLGQTWRDKGGKFAALANSHYFFESLHRLAEATQILHLGMESYSEWLDRKNKRRRKQKSKNKKGSS